MPKLKPFFCYLGGKYRSGLRYPQPDCNLIIEPFCGGAGYSLRHFDKQVWLNDLNPKVAGLWDYLIHVSEDEIRSLPVDIEHLDNHPELCHEAKWLIGWWFNKGGNAPGYKPTAWAKIRPKSNWGPEIRERIASQVQYIRHWKVTCDSYLTLPNIKASWFIDPPYVGLPGMYKNSVDYSNLASWCEERPGQAIVCENGEADWLPFTTLGQVKVTPRPGKGFSQELVWIKENTSD